MTFNKKEPKRTNTKNRFQSTNGKQRLTAILQQKLKCTLRALCGQGALEVRKSEKSDLRPYAKMCFPWSMGSKITIKLTFKR